MRATTTIEELRGSTRELRRAAPEVWRAFTSLHDAAMRPGALDSRTKELIALAIGAAKGCDGCVAYHARAAAQHGATRAEVAEALGVVLLMDGGPATTHAPRAFAAYLDFVETEAEDVVAAADGG
jgi:AhpD family alkylhydroperoxidase